MATTKEDLQAALSDFLNKLEVKEQAQAALVAASIARDEAIAEQASADNAFREADASANAAKDAVVAAIANLADNDPTT